mmetsp:Transcript_98006/g.211265  ORF Transcript_98006/g.211265 Transcript_98006/m.211265 type:complete len:337 (-) Transcript_98006:33-1043(-)
MDTVGERLARAQASGNLDEVRAALEEARKAGADPAQIELALAEVSKQAGLQTAAPQADPVAEARARAEALKKLGNEALKAGTKSAAREAQEAFTSGIEVKCTDPVLNAQLYGNRAHVRIMLRQFVEAVDDCRKAIELDPKNLKSYWRGAKASMHLDLHQNAIDFCELGLALEPKDTDLARLRDTSAEKLQSQQKKRAMADRMNEAMRGQMPGDFNPDEAMAIQEKVGEIAEQVEEVKMQIAGREREKMKCTLTKNQLADVPAETRLFRAIGRTFIREERAEVDESITTTIASVEEEVPRLKKALTELEKRKEGAEKELQEMVRAYKQASGGGGGSN